MKETINKFFPFVARAREPKSLAIVIVVYLVIAIVAGIILGVCSHIPVVKFVVGIVGSLVELYVIAGIVIAVLVYTKTLEL